MIEIFGFTVAPIVLFLMVRGIIRMIWELSEPLVDYLKDQHETKNKDREKKENAE